jgi:SAM-dependent methyltransferase
MRTRNGDLSSGKNSSKVVAVDISEPMLIEARSRCASLGNVEFVRGDFRTFDLNREFDALVCASDSLNYVRDQSELTQVLSRVKAHLVAGGFLFLMRSMTERCASCHYGKPQYPSERRSASCTSTTTYSKESRKLSRCSTAAWNCTGEFRLSQAMYTRRRSKRAYPLSIVSRRLFTDSRFSAASGVFMY